MDGADWHSKPKNPWKRLWLKHQFDVICTFGVLVFVMLVYHIFSDGDFSFLMTLGSLMTLFSFGTLVAKVSINRSVAGISLKTLTAYAVVFVARLCSILVYEGYLPYDKTGDWFYQAAELTALVLVLLLIGACTILYPASYSKATDCFTYTGVPSELGVLVLMLPALLLAAIFHPSLNNNWFTDTAWTFALYLEAVAIVPQTLQIWKMSKAGKEIDAWVRNYVFGLALSRVLHLIFWASSYHELNDKYDSQWHKRYPGFLVVAAQLLNIALMADFSYHHLMAAREKRGLILPNTV